MNALAFLFWNPAREVFDWSLPFLGRPIYWYGLFFALGFTFAYLIFKFLLKNHSDLVSYLKKPFSAFLDSITVRIAAGAVIGARLFDVLFYQGLSSFKNNPLRILYVWEGGLASHGGAIGIIIALALFFYKKEKEIKWVSLDALTIPVSVAAAFIRIGNFFNQEILGTLSTMPWAIVFGSPIDDSLSLPRHPVQLYESLFYLSWGAFLYQKIRKKAFVLGEKRLFGLFLSVVFSFRFLIEFLKEEQSNFWNYSFTMGQLLSLPFIAYGLILALSKPKLEPVNYKRRRDAR